MPIVARLTGSGLAPAAARHITGVLDTTLTATGTNQATALAIYKEFNHFTTVASSTGCILRADLNAGDSMVTSNYGAQTLSVYPPGTGAIQNGSASAAFSVAANKVAKFICLDGGANASFAAILSA